MHARIVRGLESLAATQDYLNSTSQYQKEIFLSAGGRDTGKVWTTIPTCRSLFWDDDHFKCAAAMRLGVLKACAGAACQIERANGDKCLHAIKDPVVHPQMCAVGPARLRPHRSLAVRLHKLAMKAGIFSDLERAVPSLYRRDAT
eukprot:5055989-Karenia_brevis.AAC.1